MKRFLLTVAVAAFLGFTATGAAAQDSNPGKSKKTPTQHSLKHHKRSAHLRPASIHPQTSRPAHHRKHAVHRHSAKTRKHGGR